LHQAVHLEWPSNGGTRVMFHIGDAPPHGKIGGRGQQYHDKDDDHPNGHDSDVPLNKLFQVIREKEIDYYFGKINGSCGAMLEIFAGHYGRPIQQYDTSNPASIASSVSSSISESVSTRSALAGDRRPDERYRLPPLDKSTPKWTMIPVESCTVMKLNLPESVKAILDWKALEQSVIKSYIQVAPRPFDHGSVRLALYGRQLWSGHTDGSATSVVRDVPGGSPTFTASCDMVFKQFIKPPTEMTLDRSRYMVDLETQAVAAFFADCFNERLKRTTAASPIRLKFLMAKLARLEVDGGFRFLALEKMFRGDKVTMLKYTNNYSFVRASDSDEMEVRCALAVAFTHFTHDLTDGYCMVTDLQGIETNDSKGRDVMLLTDPAIHCPGALRFGKTNMQQAGVDAFFKVHACNKYCTALGLRVPSRTD